MTIAALLLFLVTSALVWAACSVTVASVRDGLAYAVLSMALSVALTTEALGAMHALRTAAIAVVWLLIAAAAGTVVWHRRSELRILGARLRSRAMADGAPHTRVGRWFQLLLLAGLIGYAASAFVIAVSAPPNNWDSLTYHMSRVAHWRSQGSLSVWTTQIDRQIWTPPLAEYGVLHTVLLAGSDRLAGLVQWTSYVAAVLLVSVTAARLGARRLGQLGAAVVAATTPVVIAEAPTTQTDLVAGALTLATVVIVLRQSRQPATESPGLPSMGALAVAVGVGLTMLTKPTGLIVLAPFLAVWALKRVRMRPLQFMTEGVVGLVLVLAVVGPWMHRNQQEYGNPLGPKSGVLVEEPGLRAFVADGVRLVASNVAVPVASVNARTERTVDERLRALGIDPSGPGWTFGPAFDVAFSRNEDYVGNPALLACAVAAGIMIFTRRAFRSRAAVYVGCVVAGVVLFCAAIAWQPWINRLTIPSVLLAAVFVGIALEAVPRRLAQLVAVVLIVVGLPWAVDSQRRPLHGPTSALTADRSAGYFLDIPTVGPGYRAVVQRATQLHVRTLGVVQSSDSWEYPLWALQSGSGAPGTVAVEDVTTLLAQPGGLDRRPDLRLVTCIVACDAPPGWRRTPLSGGVVLLERP